MKIALIQLNIAWEDKERNLERADFFIRKAASESCDLVVLPEMFNTGFSMNISEIGEEIDGETASFLSKCAKKEEINIIGGFPVKKRGCQRGLNMAVAFDRKGMCLAGYSKLHPFSFAGEDSFYQAGDETVIFNLEGIQSSIFICYDLRFPEVFRSVAKKVHALYVIANWPSVRRDHWVTLLKARAVENQCFVIGVNRTGTDGNGLDYPGASYIFGPLGETICQGNEKDEFITEEIDPSIVAKVREQFPFLKDMREKKWV